MSTAHAQVQGDQADEPFPPHPHNVGPYVITEEDADWLEAACIEADEDEKAGRLIPIADVLARRGGP